MSKADTSKPSDAKLADNLAEMIVRRGRAVLSKVDTSKPPDAELAVCLPKTVVRLSAVTGKADTSKPSGAELEDRLAKSSKAGARYAAKLLKSHFAAMATVFGSIRYERKPGPKPKDVNPSDRVIVMAFNQHHKEDGKKISRTSPASLAQIVKLTNDHPQKRLSKSTVSRFLEDKLGKHGYRQYWRKCIRGGAPAIARLLRKWTREVFKATT